MIFGSKTGCGDIAESPDLQPDRRQAALISQYAGTAGNGDVVNKIGTYLKALAAHDNGVPFYVALSSPTIGDRAQIPIEKCAADEVSALTGRTANGRIETVKVVPESSPVANYAFDVTSARS